MTSGLRALVPERPVFSADIQGCLPAPLHFRPAGQLCSLSSHSTDSREKREARADMPCNQLAAPVGRSLCRSHICARTEGGPGPQARPRDTLCM